MKNLKISYKKKQWRPRSKKEERREKPKPEEKNYNEKINVHTYCDVCRVCLLGFLSSG
jgi:hypothetical protein